MTEDTLTREVKKAEFKIGDLFDAQTKTLKEGKKLETNKKKTEFFDTPATSSATTDNGIGFYVHGKSHNILSGVLTVTSNGINSGTMFFQPWDFAIAQDSYALLDKSGKMTKNVCLYIMSIFNAVNTAKYNYVNKSGWKRVSNDTITLPVTEDGTPDWDYMNDYMIAIQKKHLDQVESYNRRNELILKKAHPELDTQDGLDEPEGGFREFKVGELFECKLGTQVKDMKPSGNIPVITGNTSANGVAGYVNQWEDESFIFNDGITVAMRGKGGTSYYQPSTFLLGHNSMVLKPKYEISPGVKLYMSAVLNKQASDRYNIYPTLKDYPHTVVSLPATKDGTPDWDYMEQYMNRILNAQRERVRSYITAKRRQFCAS